MIQVGDAKILISAEDKASAQMKGIERSLDSLGKQATKAGLIMMAAGVAIAAAVFKMADSYTKAGDEVAKMAKRTGWSTEALSEMRYAAKLSGTSIESLEKGMKRMSSTIEDAKDGLSTTTIAFDKLGLSIEDVKAMSPEEQFWAIANALAEVEHEGTRAALAQDMFGRAGTELLPMLAAGTEGIADMRQEAHDLGLVFTEEASVACEDFQDAITKLKEALAGLGAEIIDDLIPVLENYIEKAIEIVERMTVWADAHPGLAEGLLKLAAILMVGGALLLGLGMLAKAIIAINAALIVMHALAGPAGWAKLAIGIALAAAAIYGMSRLLAWKPGEPEIAVPEVPEIAAIPTAGVAAKAYGGGVAGGLRGGAMAGTTVHISMGNYLGDETSLREFVRAVKDIFNQDVRRTSFSSVNVLGYFPGSSAP